VATVDSVIKQHAQRHEQRLHPAHWWPDQKTTTNKAIWSSVVYFLKVHINAVTSYH
jgi:hypothetical protein